ncbi:UNVERIFIED_CONTAM: hypothetical protein FKN15_008435 [Acipenser sinensis]
MEAAHISPELPIRWVVSADRTVEIKEEVTELGCDQANERILQEETSPSSITERGTDMKLSELEPVPIKDEAQEELETVHIKKESHVLESVHIKEESPVQESVHIKRVVLNSKPLSSLQGSLPCSKCGESFNPEQNLETSPGKTVHRCAGCVETFRESGILNGQQQTGTGKTPYNCHECGADFRHHSTVKHHLRVLKVQLGYPCERQDSEPVHIKVESPELEPVHIKKEVTLLEQVHIKEESPALESEECEHLSGPTMDRNGLITLTLFNGFARQFGCVVPWVHSDATSPIVPEDRTDLNGSTADPAKGVTGVRSTEYYPADLSPPYPGGAQAIVYHRLGTPGHGQQIT